MTAINNIEADRLKIIIRILTKYVTGNHHASRYPEHQRQADIKRIEEIKKLLNASKKRQNNNTVQLQVSETGAKNAI